MKDMCLYGEDGTIVYPPDDLDDDRAIDDDEEGKWRLVTVEWGYVFNVQHADESKNSLVKGYGRVTVLKAFPQEQYYEFAYWDVPENNAGLPEDEQLEPGWGACDMQWPHTWQNL
jgi:hypothetical protein